MRRHLTIHKLRDDQSGLAAIFVTIIITLLVTLTVVSFSIISNREHGQAFDRQLSTEAYYAAESGINDAYSAISTIINDNLTNPEVGSLIPSQTSCNSGVYSSTNKISTRSSVSYSCLLVNPAPTVLSYTTSPGQSDIVELVPQTGEGGISNITINWSTSDENNANSCSSFTTGQVPTLPASSSWPAGCPALLKIDLVPVSNTGVIVSEDALETSTQSFYVYPTANDGGTAGYPVKNATMEAANCSSGSCNLTITGTNAADLYYLRFEPIYGSNTTVNISATGAGGLAGSGAINLVGAEAQVDSTGKAQDVLRRLQTYIPINPSLNTNPNLPSPPLFAIQSTGSICKRLQVGYVNGNNETFSSISYPAGFTATLTSPTGDVESCGGGPNSVATPPTGTAGIIDCNDIPEGSDPVDCPTPPNHPGMTRTFYVGYLENDSYNPGLTVESCVWTWMDGTTSNTGCQPGDWVYHCYPIGDNTTYYPTLQVFLSNGAKPTTSFTVPVPYDDSAYFTPAQCSVPDY
jgi:hypothetical protein